MYPKTNTFCCFSSNCNAGTGDAIQFIELYEKCSKHEALKKVTELAGRETPAAPATLLTETDTLTKTAVLSKAFTIFKKALPLTKRAVDYLQSRSLDYKHHETGFINAGYHHELGKEVAESLIDPSCRLGRHGLLKTKTGRWLYHLGKGGNCFSLKLAEQQVCMKVHHRKIEPNH